LKLQQGKISFEGIEIMQRYWTDSELSYLEQNYASSTAKEIARELNRSVKSVQTKVEYLTTLSKRNVLCWTVDEENKLLTLLRSNLDYSEIKKHFQNRSITSLKVKAFNLRKKLKKK
jgi:predicted transcriptional regulator